jgi:hypothetical protein
MAASFDAQKASPKSDTPDIGKEYNYDDYAYHHVEAAIFCSLETK